MLSHRGEEARGGLPDAIEIRTADATSVSAGIAAALAGVDKLVIALAFKNLPVEAPRKGRTSSRSTQPARNTWSKQRTRRRQTARLHLRRGCRA